MRNKTKFSQYLLGFTVACAALFGAVEEAKTASTSFATPGPYSYTVPAGVTRIQVQVAGSGGGGGGYDNATAGNGGQGGLVTLTLSVTPGQVLTGTVAGGGVTGWTGGISGFAGCSGGGAAGAGFIAGGAGGNANCPAAVGYSGGGGGGGGSTSLVLSGIGLAQAGGGGGGGGSTNGGVGGNGGNSSTFAVNASCLSTTVVPAGGSWTGDGGGGGGAGGGYIAGTGGAAAIDGGSPTGGGGAQNCYSSNAAVLSASVTSGGGLGAARRTATSGTSNGTGGNGSVVFTTFPSLTLTVVSNGGIAAFPFTGANGWANQTLTTVTPGVGVTGALQTFTSLATATTITETIPPGNAMTAVACTGMGPGGTATPNLATGVLVFNAAALALNADIACTVTHTAQAPSIRLQKALGGTGRVAAADQFSLNATGTGAPAAVITTGTGTAITSAAMSFTATAGSTYSLNEAMAAGSTSPLSRYVRTVTCSNSNGAGTTVSGISSLPISFTAATGDVISCTITNSPATPVLTISKVASTPGPVNVGDTIVYTYTVANTGNVVINNVAIADLHGSPAVLVPTGPGGVRNETLTVPGPLGAGASPDSTANNGVWSTLAPGATVQYQYTHTVTQAEIDNG
jgi:hypothetical protein